MLKEFLVGLPIMALIIMLMVVIALLIGRYGEISVAIVIGSTFVWILASCSRAVGKGAIEAWVNWHDTRRWRKLVNKTKGETKC